MQMDYLVSIDTKQKIEGEEENLQVITHASFSGNAGDYTLFYTEENSGGGESRTEIRCENGEKVSVVRSGDGMTTNLILEKGVRHISCHSTPYGNFSMGIRALEIFSDMNEEGGRLRFSYLTDIENTPLGEIAFDFTLTKKMKRD